MLIFMLFLIPQLLWAHFDNSTCQTPECSRLGARFSSHMNSAVEPCDDFYEFVCGNYAQNHAIPEHAKSIMTFNEMQTHIDRQLKDFIINSSGKSLSRELRLAVTYYESCVNEEHKEQLGKKPLLHQLRALFGGWHFLDAHKTGSFNESSFEWEKLAGELTLYGIHALIKPFVWNNPHNSSQNMLMLISLDTVLPHKDDYFTSSNGSESSNLEHYREYMESILMLLGADENSTEDMVEEIINFEIELANLTRYSSGKYDHNGVPMTYGDLKNQYKNINWDLFFHKELLLGTIQDSMSLQNINPDYFEMLNELMVSISPSTVKNYLMWRVVASFNELLSAEFRAPLNDFIQKMIGSNVGSSDWETCTIEVRDKFGTILAAEFIKTYFTEADKSLVKEMIQDLKKSMKTEIEESDWMDDVTKKAALSKLEAMSDKTGYPDDLFNMTEIERQFKGVLMDSRRYLENAVKLRKVAQLESLYDLKRVGSLDWRGMVLGVNAFYNAYGNEMILPASLAHFPMLVAGAPISVNYGAYGTAIGHEMTHGFDDGGAMHNSLGNLENWWDNTTMQEFENKTKCFVNQYGKETEPKTGKKYNGKFTLGENIADNGGLRMGWLAYQQKSQLTGDVRTLPFLPGQKTWTSDQIFFISYVNTYCVNAKTAAIDDIMNTDVHTFEAARVNVPLRNLAGFASTFGCAVGSGMRPERNETCRVW